MPTTSHALARAETRSASIAASPQAVLDLIADPRNLPRWAPAFARSVRIDDGQVFVDTGGVEASIDVIVSRERGTVDIVSSDVPTRGAFSRVVPNGESGSEYVFTLFFDPDAEEAAISAQMRVVDGELEAVRGLCEPAA
jgi:hypothetical protein